MSVTTLVVLAVLLPYVGFFVARPQSRWSRPLRFVLAYLATLAFGTFRQLDPEGRSVRVGPIRALRYAWEVSA